MTFDKRHLLKSAYNYTQAGQWDRALEEYRKVVRLFPEDPNIHSMIADLLVKKGENVAAAKEHLEAARYFREQGAEEKELSSLRKALRVKAGDVDAVTAMEKHFDRALQTAQKRLTAGQLEDAEAIGNRLLDADPGHLGANRLIDDLKAARLQAASQAAMDEEAEVAEAEPGAGDATREVLARLQSAATAYLDAQDFDSAIDTLLVMLKLDPASPHLRSQLDLAQDQLKVSQAAQQKWQEMQAKQAAELEQAKDGERSRLDLESWRDEEEAVQKRLEEEQRLAEESARQELSIIENAVKELSTTAAAASASAVSAEDEARLKALMAERESVQKRVEIEHALAQQQEVEAEARRLREAEMLAHAIELAKQEAEAQAKAVAMQELEARLSQERERHKAEMEAERSKLALHEAEFQKQMRQMMQEEMDKLRAQLAAERQQLASSEAAVTRKEAAVKQEIGAAASALSAAEEAARKEREALAKMKKEEDERRQAFVQEAMKRRQARQGAGSEEKSAVMRTSMRISDALHAATTKHLNEDVEAMLETAKRYLKQDLLLDALRICQKVSEKEPDNEKVKVLLKEIYVRKGI